MVIELLHISQYVARERRARARLGQVLLLLLLLATAMLLMLAGVVWLYTHRALCGHDDGDVRLTARLFGI